MACQRLPLGGILALLLCWLGASCKSASHDDAASATAEFRRGEGVVVESAAGVFFEGRVLAVGSGVNLRIQQLPGGDTMEVTRHDAYPLSMRGGAIAGDFAICHTREAAWVACRIDAAREGAVTASSPDGAVHTLVDADVMRPTAVTRLNVAQLFSRTQRRAEFKRAVMRAGSPRAPPGWSPEAMERVIVRRDAYWFTARMREASDGGVVVELPGAHGQESFPRDRVVPLPPYDHGLRPGQFALLAPTVPAEPWRAVRIEEVRADAVDVVDDNEAVSRVRLRDLVPISR